MLANYRLTQNKASSTLIKLIFLVFNSQGASGIIFPIIKGEGVRQMFFPATIPAYYRAPPAPLENKLKAF